LNVTEISETVDAGSVTEFELQISNYGFQDLTYNISDDRTWISENPDNGTVSLGETDIVVITFDATLMTPGTYIGTVTVDSNDPENLSIDLPVSLLVTDPAQEIPTLSEWGMIIMALLLLAAGTIAVIRRRQVSIKKTAN